MKKLKYFFTSAIVLVAVVVSTVVFAEYKEQKGDLRLGNQISNKSVTVTKGSLAEDGDVQVTKTVSKTDVEGKYKVTFEVKGKDKKTTSEVKKPVYAVVVFDRSNSMSERPFKYRNAKSGARTFANTLLKKIPNANLALVAFSGNNGYNDSAFDDAEVLREFSNSNFDNVNFGNTYGGTNLYAGLYEANKLLSNKNVVPSDAIKYVVVISDGEPTFYYDDNGYTLGNGQYMDADNKSKTIDMATTVKKQAEIFAIGYNYRGTILNNIATSDKHVVNSDPETVANAFSNIAETISKAYAGTDAILTDGIGAKFSMTDAEGNTYTSEKFDITETGKTFSFDITIDDDKITEDGWYPTNAGFSLTYTDADGNKQTITCDENPEVYWEVDKYDYTIEYYYNNVKDADLTETGTLAKGKEFGVTDEKIKANTKYGYKFDKATPDKTSAISSEKENVIKVYYVADETQTKKISYTVNYYKDGVLQTSDTEKVTKTIQVLETTGKVDISKINVTNKYVGYKFDKTNPSVIPETFKNGDVIDVYYVLDESQTKEISYTVNYYKDGVLQTSDIEKITKTVQVLETTGKVETSKINVTNKYFGYKFDKTNPSSIPEVFEDGDVIDVYYVTDESKVKELTYTVEYYIDGVLQTKDTQIVTKTVQVLESDNLTVNKSEINTKDKYVGYRFKESNPSIIPDEIKTGEVIKVYYILDESQTKEISYTVNYYKDGVLQTSDIEKVTKTVQVLETTGKVETSKINVTNKYFGYKFEKTEPSVIPETFKDGDIIDVYYVTDEDKVKELTYTVEYYIDGVLQTKDTQIVTKTVQVLESDNLTVNKSEINTKDKYVGYRFKESNPSIIPDEIKTGEVIKVYYILDESQTKEISYTVNYYKDGVLQTSDIEKVTKTVQVLETTGKVDANRINVTNKYVGYVFDKTNPSSIPEIFEDGDVINVYYVKGKFTYEVRYYYDRVLDESKTDTFDAYYGDVIESYTDKSTTDYVLEMVENLPLIITEKDNVINVYYKTDGKGVIVPDEDPLPPNTSSNASIYIMLTLVNALGASVLLRKKEN